MELSDEAISLILAGSGRLLHSVRNDGGLEHIVPPDKQFYTRHGEKRND